MTLTVLVAVFAIVALGFILYSRRTTAAVDDPARQKKTDERADLDKDGEEVKEMQSSES